DYSLANPDTLTKYKVAAQISQKVLHEVSGWCTEGASIVELCERGDKLLEDEVSKVYKGKKVPKGIGHCTTISPSSYVTPYTPLKSDAEEAATTLKKGEPVKIQLGAQIDGFPAIVCDTVIVGASGEVTGRDADLMLATYYANELLLRLMLPPGLIASGTEEEQKAASSKKAYSQSQITQMLEKVVSAYDCNLVESTTIWQFDHNEIEAKKKIILAPGEGVKGEGLPEVGEAWGVEMGVSTGSGKVKNLSNRTTLHRRTATTYGLKRPTSRAILSEVVKKFGTFPFSLRQLEDEKSAKVGVVECVRGGVLRQYEVVGEKNNDPVARLFTTIAITKNGITRLAAPPALDLSKFKTDKKITDEEILKILEQPLGKTANTNKNKNRKKKKKTAKKAETEEDESSDDEGRTGLRKLAKSQRSTSNLPLDTPETHPDALTKCSSPCAAMRPFRKSNRKSRPSTPYATPTDHDSPPPEAKRAKTQISLHTWVEPTPNAPAPSFAEHGFARHGVLETMGALGEPPSAKVRQRARALPDVATRRSNPEALAGMLGAAEGASTPEVTPGPDADREDTEMLDDEDLPSVPPSFREGGDDDGDWVPGNAKGKKHPHKPVVRGRPLGHSRESGATRTPAKNGITATVSTASTPAAPSLGPITGNARPEEGTMTGAQREVEVKRLQIVVQDAVMRAREDHDIILGEALQQLWASHKTDDNFRATLEALLRKHPTVAEYEAFRRYIKDAKKSVKRQHKQHQQAAGMLSKSRSSRISSATSPVSAKPTRTFSPTKSVKPIPSALDNNGFVNKATHFDPMLISDDEMLQTNGHNHGVPLADGLGTSSKSPSKKPRSKGPAVPIASVEGDAAALSKTATPAVDSPDSIIGAGSDDGSELSDFDEDIVKNGPPEQARLNGTNKPAAVAVKKPNPAIARAGKKARQGSAKPSGKERKPLTAEQLVEEERLQRRREQLSEQQAVRHFTDFPLSNARPDRYEDETMDTESLTESQYAVGPPVNTKQLKGKMPAVPDLHINTGKRLRDEHTRFSSPRVHSAASSRPTTPAFAPPTTKRVKLNNGQAARTKRSPVKNRDGPIAGIASNGGGSRHFGPDDNDPASPPSESDDFCSACKGAGEFVCCDHCSRVYHFLCCDPPRKEPPDGSFACHECCAKYGLIEDPLPSSFKVFGPLLRSLEVTNTRSFALPTAVQNYFEGVSARPDGSYGEEIKRFPLSKNTGYGYQKPDYLRTHDAEHKIILCAQCGQTSGGKRQMIKCDYCDAYWHLDCCDPPLANPPPVNQESAMRDAWKCPRHVDNDFRSGLLYQQDVEGDDDVAMGEPGARVPRRVRKPKKPVTVDPLFSRGMRNNGLIEVANDPDDETDGEGNYIFAEETAPGSSKVFRVPEKGIILDFITKTKQQREASRQAQRDAALLAAARAASLKKMTVRPIEQQQAALELVRLARREPEVGLGEKTVEGLALNLLVSPIVNFEFNLWPVTDSSRPRHPKTSSKASYKPNMAGATTASSSSCGCGGA
ncbi:hypothetical protein M011DRAFT_403120, partial [Sporormia fimetaria CBS 119925]